jgi:general secretion pathway protein G
MPTTIRRGSRNRLSAFTLIELLLVMVIISILAAIVVPRYIGSERVAKEKAAIGSISVIKTALAKFEIDNGRLPTTEEGLQALVVNPNPTEFPTWTRNLDKLSADPWGHPFIYRHPGTDGGDYDLISTGSSGQEGNPDNIKG